MPNVTTAPQADSLDPYEGLPAAWSESARETYVQVEEESPGLGAAQRAALFEACALIALADEMEKRVVVDGLMVNGSQGQPVPHGLVSEVRLARTQAIGALKSFGIAPGQTSASRAGTVLAMQRHHPRTGRRGNG